ncbi:MAG: tyrosine-type recombinase/integrase [Sphingopyxis sp.]
MTKDWPPPHVSIVTDRHGKKRFRYRRAGVKGGYIGAEPKTQEFWQIYADFEAQGVAEKQPVKREFKPYSMDDLAAKVKRTRKWNEMLPRGQAVKGRIIERLLDKRNKAGTRLGDRDARTVTIATLDGILGKLTHGTAGNFRKEMKRLFAYAVKLKWRADNPAKDTDPVKQGKGWHTWTNEEIEQYRATHPYGTTARLVLELALNTTARRCNLNDLERRQIVGDKIEVAHAKGNDETKVPILPETRLALDAMSTTHIKYLIVGAHGKPYTVEGLGNKMRRWCDRAALPHCSLHGLRKATSRQLAESGASDAEGRAVTGHKKDATFAYYAAKANREALADHALSNLVASRIVQPEKSDGTTDA